MDHLAGGIELDHERRQMPGIQFTVQHVLAIEEEHVVLRIDAMSAEPARNGRADRLHGVPLSAWDAIFQP